MLRAVSAFMIVIAHGWRGFNEWFGMSQVPHIFLDDTTRKYNLLGRVISLFTENLRFGVEIFFLISGFLITYLLLSEKAKNGKVDFYRFYIRRGLRIWPLYFLLIALLPLWHFLTRQPYPDLLPNLLFYNNFHTISTMDWQPPFGHFWSICVEEHFYLAWPLIIGSVPNKKLPFAFALLILISIVSRWYYVEAHAANYGLHLFINTICAMDTLVIGAVIAYIHFHKPIRFKIPTLLRIVVYSMLLILLLNVDITVSDTFFTACFKKYIYTGFSVFWLMNILFNEHQWHIFEKKSIMSYLGRISYGIYMFHNILIGVIDIKILPPLSMINIWAFWFFYLVLSIGLPIISYQFFEKYFLRLKRKFELVRTDE